MIPASESHSAKNTAMILAVAYTLFLAWLLEVDGLERRP